VRFAPFLVAFAAVGAFAFQPSPAPAAAPPADTRTVYLRDCGVCHGAGGQGGANGPAIAGTGRAIVDYEISTGRMPLPEPDAKTVRRPVRYPPAQIQALVDYVASFAPGGEDIPSLDLRAASLADGGEQYRLQCAACHAWAGDGGALVNREAPGLRKATPTQVAEAVRSGPGEMPAFGAAALNDGQLASVVRYVEYLKHPRDQGGFSLWHLGPVAEGAVAWVIGIALLILATRWIGERS
jgi:ubiquinol-cytochrome c reductase cytochrome c subunit